MFIILVSQVATRPSHHYKKTRMITYAWYIENKSKTMSCNLLSYFTRLQQLKNNHDDEPQLVVVVLGGFTIKANHNNEHDVHCHGFSRACNIKKN
jgi:hypothetical protein